MFIRPELGGKVQDVYFSLHTVLVCWRIFQFHDFVQDIRVLPEARIRTEPAGEIRGGLHE